jgi:type II secretory pathway pseudopilin PulG
MKRGFSLVELTIALVLLQVGILATAGMILQAQRDLTRAELVVRGVLDAQRVGDSLLALGGEGPPGRGTVSTLWGEVAWSPANPGSGGVRLVARRLDEGDTLAVLSRWPALPDTLFEAPKGGGGG